MSDDLPEEVVEGLADDGPSFAEIMRDKKQYSDDDLIRAMREVDESTPELLTQPWYDEIREDHHPCASTIWTRLGDEGETWVDVRERYLE